MHKNSYLKMKWFKENYLDSTKNLNILDVGSLSGDTDYNYSNIFNEKNWNYVGLDFEDGNNVDIVVDDIYDWKEIKNDSYDVVISGQFFEHLGLFWRTLSEINRVLKYSGHLCIIVPSSGPKHGGSLPNCYLFREDGLKSMAEEINFVVLHTSIDNRKDAAPWHDACLVAQKINKNRIKKPDELLVKMDKLDQELDSFLNLIK